MTLDLKINWRPEIGKKVDAFFNNPGYKAYLESAVSFNRKLNEERKMRIPFIDSQTGVAQRNYNKERHKRERMPGMKFGQIYSYPQRSWRKKKYQYLESFMKPVNDTSDLESELHTISQIENPAAEKSVASSTSTNSTTTTITDPVTNDDIPTVVNGDTSDSKKEDTDTMATSTTTNNNATTTTKTASAITSTTNSREWVYYDDDEAFMDEDLPEINSDGDSDFGESFGSRKKKKSKGGRGSRGGRGRGKGRK